MSIKESARIFFVVLIPAIFGCHQPVKNPRINKIGFSAVIIDSLKNISDSIYVKPYFSRDFAQATYYINKKDSTAAQVMRDLNHTVRQVVFTRNKNRIYIARYYPNGQLMEKVGLDKYGQYDGPATSYFQNGLIESMGIYKSGIHSGNWKCYDSIGGYTLTEQYNADGQKIKSFKE